MKKKDKVQRKGRNKAMKRPVGGAKKTLTVRILAAHVTRLSVGAVLIRQEENKKRRRVRHLSILAGGSKAET